MYKIGIIAKYWNEEVLLPHWLDWLNLIPADHIFLGDDGSTDKSAEICRNYNHVSATVHNYTLEHPHEGYFENKIPEGEKVNGMLVDAYLKGCNWVLHLDIDEFPSLPMLEYICQSLRHTPGEYGIYFSIFDCYESPTTIILQNTCTGFNHYPCPHLKIFGKHSHFMRVVDGMKLDQGVTGGVMYIMTPYPYLHLKGLFKNRRTARGCPLTQQSQPQLNKSELKLETIPPLLIPSPILSWFHGFKEPETTW